MNLRKIVATALSSSDLSDRLLVETALDRVRALAFADSLGGALWRLKYANQADAYQRVVLLLTKRIRRKHESATMMQKVAEYALREHLDGPCRACGGRGAIADANGVRRVCGTCGGGGGRQLSEVARRRAFGVSERAYAKVLAKLQLAHDRLAEADMAAGRDVAGQLGRIGGMMTESKALALFRGRSIIPISGPAQNQNDMPEPTANSTSGA